MGKESKNPACSRESHKFYGFFCFTFVCTMIKTALSKKAPERQGVKTQGDDGQMDKSGVS